MKDIQTCFNILGYLLEHGIEIQEFFSFNFWCYFFLFSSQILRIENLKIHFILAFFNFSFFCIDLVSFLLKIKHSLFSFSSVVAGYKVGARWPH